MLTSPTIRLDSAFAFKELSLTLLGLQPTTLAVQEMAPPNSLPTYQIRSCPVFFIKTDKKSMVLSYCQTCLQSSKSSFKIEKMLIE